LDENAENNASVQTEEEGRDPIQYETRCGLQLRKLSLCLSCVFNSGNYMYHLLYHSKSLHSAHTVYLCVPYGYHNKQRLFP
jgi:hypothetical protein